ncbi:anti-sigma factor [Rossellomorea vietnamensis]|jgi:anti-sigma factor RsiW|uniref:Anti-sigma factor n=1 Tax=Rossellomorea vietnamensis TaxID=218284 RepID=A0ACD4C1M7_9BACI|nr:anti-sigma factor [Rossellomorea vietnamensis]UXH42443.1 anti-sigma factor [Rossellomorea vietnamensis]
MTTQQCDQLLDYYNGHLSELEKAQFEKHLKSCPQCQEELHELEQLMDYMPFASDVVEPPKDLEDRVMAGILGEEKRTANVEPPAKKKKKTWFLPSVAAALFLSLIGNAYLFSQLEDQDEVVEQATIDQVVQYVDLAAVNGNARGTASIIKQGAQTSMVVQASELQELSNEEVYQVWLIKDDQPERAGTFVTSKDGKGSVVFKFNEEFTKKDWDTVAITLEPDANSQLPQGDIVLASEI